MKKIVFGITNLNMGGAEKILVDLVNKLCSEYDITIFTIYGHGDLESELDKSIKLISYKESKYEELSFFEKRKMSLMFRNKFFLKSIYKQFIDNKFDREIAFLEGPMTSLMAQSSNLDKIAWIHTNLSLHLSKTSKKKNIEETYKKYKKIIFVSQDALKGFNSIFKIKNKKLVINNYIDAKKVINVSKEKVDFKVDKTIPTFISVCRLVKAKGVDRLLLASKKLINDGYNHKIYIIGDGPLKPQLIKLIDTLEMKDNFILLGQKSNPYPYVKKVKNFVLASLYEGYPTVIVEAMILEKMIISTNTGAREVLNYYDNKLIVDNDFMGIYNGLKKVITNKYKIKTTKQKKYNSDKIIEEIKTIL